MAQQWGESFGGPPGVPVTRYGNGPQVRLKYDPSCTGRVMREGPSQSIVRWRNGNEDCVCNAWIERIDITNLSEATASSAPSPQGVQSLRVGHADKGSTPADLHTETKKPRKAPDALARRVSEFDDNEVQAFARVNGCWDDKYLQLPNLGLRRMNIINRLRAKIKHGHEVKWT